MFVRLNGWSDDDVLQLLMLFRKHLHYYIYGSAGQFVEFVRVELSDRSAARILDMVRALMKQFGLRLSTKNFRTDVITAHGQQVYVYEHLYESICQLPENRAGGVWLPGELGRFCLKARQYRGHFAANPETFFKQVQLWGKSIEETKSKFYALREVYLNEKHHTYQPTQMEAKRLELLKDIFTDVPPILPNEKVVTVSNKSSKLWSSDEIETLVDFIVRITTQIQKTGYSHLVDHVAETLHRTDRSCVKKLADMREKFMKNASTVRAANLPDSIFDPASVAHKIFIADWSDNNDPYALGYLALKSRSLRLCSRRNKKPKNNRAWSPRPRLRNTTAAHGKMRTSSRVPLSSSAKDVAATSAGNEPCSPMRQTLCSVRKPAKQFSAEESASFVRDVANQCPWTETVVLSILQCMQNSIELYRSNKIVDFYSKIASLTSDIEFLDLFADVQHILTQFVQLYGSLDGFEKLVLIAPGIDSTREAIYQTAQKPEYGLDSEGVSLTSNVFPSQHNSISSKSTRRSQDERHGIFFDEDDDEQINEASKSGSSDGEVEEVPHPLQGMLNSLESRMVELQEKQRILIKEKEDRKRHHQYVDHPFELR
ncbi:uncharacterized protein PHALS_06944 [Plasmopara halstedii]|uniref:Uncharacterized protein n=1 Tax=Plasmopara halstedii TaxID=4781 RepID=A0A0P1B368_PLAHL|nr:uncharacterized protein PHALS_06944 [Plasmopara halstedii]CEG49165.1 hypothetical protein PHALS_06944 [Plasmopara halstedii]|eukprot:XP_024585534.1 hypothetical protein PHALS_06944 [Plasmopara halstedii]